MSDHGLQGDKEVPARNRTEPAFRPEAKVIIVLCVLSIGICAYVSSWPKVLMNPRFDEVGRLAQPVIEVIRKYRREHAGEQPVDLAELLRACESAGMSGTELPPDPWGRPLIWVPRDPTFYDSPNVESLGADGRVGGGRENQDVSIWAGNP